MNSYKESGEPWLLGPGFLGYNLGIFLNWAQICYFGNLLFTRSRTELWLTHDGIFGIIQRVGLSGPEKSPVIRVRKPHSQNAFWSFGSRFGILGLRFYQYLAGVPVLLLSFWKKFQNICLGLIIILKKINFLK